MIQVMLRAERGTGAARMADDGDWNSRITGSDSRSSLLTGLIALGEGRGNSGMTGTLVIEMAVLLRPELAIDRTALEQDMVRCDVDNRSALKNQCQVAFGQ
jgi:hypothetical protein